MLADLQAEALVGTPDAVVLVEGLSDHFAVATVASKLGRDLHEDGIAIVPMGGATNIGRFLAVFGPRGRNLRIAGLCDAAEAGYFARALEKAGIDGRVGSARVFVCDRDLEDELIRALGGSAVEAIIERAGSSPSSEASNRCRLIATVPVTSTSTGSWACVRPASTATRSCSRRRSPSTTSPGPYGPWWTRSADDRCAGAQGAGFKESTVFAMRRARVAGCFASSMARTCSLR